MWRQIKKNGFGIIEMMVAIGIFLILILGGSIFLTQGFNINRLSDQETEATYYATEGLEAARSIANQNWSNMDTGNGNCNNSVNKGIGQSGTVWGWTSSPQTRNSFNRTITISNVCRNNLGNIVENGTTYDNNLKKITSTVNWSFSPTRNNTVTLTTYLSNFRASIFGDWSKISIGATLDLPGTTNALKIGVTGNFAYIIRPGTAQNFVVVDISVPTPYQVGSLSLTGNPTNIFVLGNYAYVSSDNDSAELQIVDISNPASPTLAGFYNLIGPANATDVIVVGNTAYVTQLNSPSPELTLLNISNPAAPSVIGGINLNGNALAVDVLGNYAAVASSNDLSELELVNISNPANPTLTGTYDVGGTTDPSVIIISGQYVLIGLSNGAMAVANISIPTFPFYANTYGGSGGAIYDSSLGNNGKYMFLATSAVTREIQVTDISNLTSYLNILGSYYFGNTLTGIFYDPNFDLAFAVGQSDTAELVIFKPQPL